MFFSIILLIIGVAVVGFASILLYMTKDEDDCSCCDSCTCKQFEKEE